MSADAGPTNSEILAHQWGQSVAWIILLDINIILAVLKYNRIASLLHMINGLVILFLTYFFILWYLIPYGFIQAQKQQALVYYIHAIIGCAMLGFVVLIAGSGLFTAFYRDSNFPKLLKNIVKIFHKLFAYLIVVVFKINILWNWYGTSLTVFWCLTIWDVLFFIIWLFLKLYTEKMESLVIDMRTKIGAKGVVGEVKSIAQIRQLKIPYVIYNNHIYNASEVIRHHPGGIKVIESILGRQVDRFIYGMYSSELYPEVLPYSHSTRVLSLLQNPTLKITTPNPYSEFTESKMIKVQFMSEVSKSSQIYVLGLLKTKGQFDFTGYSDVGQLGQYYSLTMNKKFTRLYTVINFITRQNISLINQMIPTLKYNIELQISWKIKRSDVSQLISYGNNKQELMEGGSREHQRYLPLMLKIYPDGKFTSALLKANFNKDRFELSEPKGLGLELQVTDPGKIVIVAGGTGLFPFSDLIDLLFKTTFMQKNEKLHEQILKRNTILKGKPFQKFNFILLAAINDSQDLHPITREQLIYLSENSSKIKVVLRISKNEDELKKMKTKIEFTREYFTSRAVSQSKSSDFSRVWICGPPKMCTQAAQSLLQNGTKRDQILLI